MIADRKTAPRRLAFVATLKLPLIIAAVALLAFAATSASAEVYKCTSAKNQTTYSDKPCTSGSKETITNTGPSVSIDADSAEQLESSMTRQMDAAVKAAIANNDYIRAQALATTQQQRDWIAAAKKEYDGRMTASLTEANLYADKSTSVECLKARSDLERAANNITNSEVLSAKTSLMQAACGVQSSPDYLYGGPVWPVFFPGHFHKLPVKTGFTSPPYDRTMAKPFGSRFIRPEDAPK